MHCFLKLLEGTKRPLRALLKPLGPFKALKAPLRALQGPKGALQGSEQPLKAHKIALRPFKGPQISNDYKRLVGRKRLQRQL